MEYLILGAGGGDDAGHVQRAPTTAPVAPAPFLQKRFRLEFSLVNHPGVSFKEDIFESVALFLEIDPQYDFATRQERDRRFGLSKGGGDDGGGDGAGPAGGGFIFHPPLVG